MLIYTENSENAAQRTAYGNRDFDIKRKERLNAPKGSPGKVNRAMPWL